MANITKQNRYTIDPQTKPKLFTLRAARRGRFACSGNAGTSPMAWTNETVVAGNPASQPGRSTRQVSQPDRSARQVSQPASRRVRGRSHGRHPGESQGGAGVGACKLEKSRESKILLVLSLVPLKEFNFRSGKGGSLPRGVPEGARGTRGGSEGGSQGSLRGVPGVSQGGPRGVPGESQGSPRGRRL